MRNLSDTPPMSDIEIRAFLERFTEILNADALHEDLMVGWELDHVLLLFMKSFFDQMYKYSRIFTVGQRDDMRALFALHGFDQKDMFDED